MTDWLYEAANAQSRLEMVLKTSSELEAKVKRYEEVLSKIATDEDVSNPTRVRWQRDHYRSISREVLGYGNTGKQKES